MGNNLFLYTQKTGQPVRVPLPGFVTDALKRVDSGDDYFFWTGKNIRSASRELVALPGESV